MTIELAESEVIAMKNTISAILTSLDSISESINKEKTSIIRNKKSDIDVLVSLSDLLLLIEQTAREAYKDSFIK